MKLFNILFKKGKESDILLPEIKTTDTNDLYKEYDKINVSISGLEYIEPYENERLLYRTKQMSIIYPDRIKRINKIVLVDFNSLDNLNGKIAGNTSWFIKNDKILNDIHLNSNKNEIEKTKRLKNIHCENKTYYEVAFVHEFAHVSELNLLELEKRWNIKNLTINIINESMFMYEDRNCNFISDEKILMNILLKILKNSNPKQARPLDFASQRLGEYAGKNYQEFLAESFVNYYCSDNPDPLAVQVVETFDKILNNLKGSS